MWIEAVVAESAARRNDCSRTAVLNFGGLHSPANANGNPNYLALVAPPAIRALADVGYDRIEVCGNLTATELGDFALRAASSVRVGPRPHEDFAAALCSADLLLTSPWAYHAARSKRHRHPDAVPAAAEHQPTKSPWL